ncbi:hypothetical protein [Streptomyces sp. SID10815]|uniref:hypothetical protein n=1 Tax=Streptomyces sp. SID10815 TaxID=2706027 RepID=UPI0013C837F3|nr:hypothetical protein [Streptomyces sp. SID10815]NEA45313.1 hypothetical protein [Streptomyces sp. SID10815]
MVLGKYQHAGLTQSEVKDFQGAQPHRQAMISAKITEIEQRRVDLRHATQLLEHALQCGAEDVVTCPEFRALSARR